MSNFNSSQKNKAYIITGPTSGIGYETAILLSNYGKVVLVSRDKEKLKKVQQTIEGNGQNGVLSLI